MPYPLSVYQKCSIAEALVEAWVSENSPFRWPKKVVQQNPKTNRDSTQRNALAFFYLKKRTQRGDSDFGG